MYGGPDAGPSAYIRGVAANALSLACIFLAILPWAFFEYVAKQTKHYAYEEWVVKKAQLDRDGKTKKKKTFVPVDFKGSRKKTPGRRHRVDNPKKRYDVTPSFVLCWIAIVIIQGAVFGSFKGPSRNLWRRLPYGVNIMFVRNAMTRNAYEFVRRYIHFADDSRQKKKGDVGYDALFKVQYALNVIMKGIRRAWTAGKHVTIDESMIRYMGRAVAFVQYMPAKPIKHGIKVFAICCSMSAVLLGFKVYVGKEDGLDGTALGICVQLILESGLGNVKGRVLYTDNWYTSMALAKEMFERFR